MITANNVSIDSKKNLRYIAEHKSVFDLEYFYPLDIFENFVQQAEGWGLECSCKIDEDRIYAARFNLLLENNQDLDYQLKAVLNFLNTVEARADVKLNYRLLQQFLGVDFDFSKVTTIFIGVDLRKELAASRLKLWFILKDYPEKVEAAIALHGEHKDLRTLLVGNSLVLVGFDFSLDNRSAIKLYPEFKQQDWLRVDIQKRLAQVLSPTALQLLVDCSAITIAFAEDNDEKTVHYHPLNPNTFISNLRHDLASRVHAHYHDKPSAAYNRGFA